MKMLSNEARLLLVKTYEEMPDVEKVAEIFSVSISSVYRIVRQMNQTGSVELKTHTRGRKPSLTPEDIENIRRAVEQEPDITIHRLREKLNLPVSDETVRTKVLSMGLRPRRKHPSARKDPASDGQNTPDGSQNTPDGSQNSADSDEIRTV